MSSRTGIFPLCKFDWDSPIESLQSTLRSARQRFSSVTSKASDEELRARPAPEVWSALEYTAHTRDGVSWYTDRINRTLAEDFPRLGGRDWERETEIRRYHEEATSDVLSGLAVACEALANLLSNLSPEDWKRQAVGSGGDRRDVLLLARRATHETEHHCLDAANSLRNLDRNGKGAIKDMSEPKTWIVSGIPGSGKTTVARLLAGTFARGVHIEGDLIGHGLIISGLVAPHEEPQEEAHMQLGLRRRNINLLANSFHNAGFTIFIDDVVVSSEILEQYVENLEGPLRFVQLCPPVEIVEARDSARHKQVFHIWKHLQQHLEKMPRSGLWLDTSTMSAQETVEMILQRSDEATLRQ